VDGPKAVAVEVSAPAPGDVPATVVRGLARLSDPSCGSLAARPDLPDGMTLRLLIASLVI
jgi:hypothetical protein